MEMSIPDHPQQFLMNTYPLWGAHVIGNVLTISETMPPGTRYVIIQAHTVSYEPKFVAYDGNTKPVSFALNPANGNYLDVQLKHPDYYDQNQSQIF